jgi:hypothetical protein
MKKEERQAVINRPVRLGVRSSSKNVDTPKPPAPQSTGIPGKNNDTPNRAKPFVFWAIPVGEFVKVECCRAEDVERERRSADALLLSCKQDLARQRAENVKAIKKLMDDCDYYAERRDEEIANNMALAKRAEAAEKKLAEAEIKLQKLASEYAKKEGFMANGDF